MYKQKITKQNRFNKTLSILLIFFLFLSLPHYGNAEIAVEEWQRQFNNNDNGNDEALAIVVDDEGNLYITGRTGIPTAYDFLILKYDPEGNKLWSTEFDHAGGDDEPFATALDKDNNIYVTGKSRNNIGYEAITLKYNSDGQKLWNSSEFTNNLRLDNLNAEGQAILVDQDNNIVVAGFARRELRVDIFVTKFDSNGLDITIEDEEQTEDWPQYYSVEGRAEAYAIAGDASGNYYVAGSVLINNTNPVEETTPEILRSIGDFLIIKYSKTGEQLWVKTHDFGYREKVSDIKIGKSGNLYVTGTTSKDLNNYLTLKLDSQDGSVIWAREDGGAREDYAYGLAVDQSENVYITGFSEGKILTIKLNTNGKEIWRKVFSQSSMDSGRAIWVDDDNHVYITGSTLNDTTLDFITIKYSQSDDIPPLLQFPADFGNGKGISSAEENDTSELTYRIIYSDPDNDPPDYVRVVIDGTSFDMSIQTDCASEECNGIYTDTELYSYTTTLEIGTHDYFFTTSDGLAETTTETTIGPDIISFEPVISTQPETINVTVSASSTIQASFSIINQGIMQTAWTAETTRPWATLSQNSGTDSDEVDVLIDTTGLHQGFHALLINITDPAAKTYQLPVNLIIPDPNDDITFESHRSFDSGKEDRAIGITTIPDGTLYMLENAGPILRITKFEPDLVNNENTPIGKLFISKKTYSGHSIAANSLGEIFVSAESNDDILLIKYNSFLNDIWNISYNPGADDILHDMALDITGNSYLLVEDGKDGSFNIVKYDEDRFMNMLPIKLEQNSFLSATEIFVDENLSMFIGGIILSENDPSSTDFKILKLDLHGKDKGSFTFDSGKNDILHKLTLDKFGAIIIAGESSGDIFTAKFTPAGELIFANSFDAGGNETAKDVITDSLGNVYVAGDDGENIYLKKYDSRGEELWSSFYDSGMTDKVTSIALSETQNIFVISTKTEGDFSSSVTIHFSQAISGSVTPESEPEPKDDKDTDDDTPLGSPPKGTSGCFIATAAFGSPMESDVIILRKFRDKFLLSNTPGRIFTSFYYRFSPPIAKTIEKHPILANAVRTSLQPLIFIAKALLPEETQAKVLIVDRQKN